MKRVAQVFGGLFGAFFLLILFSAIFAGNSEFLTNPATAGSSTGPQGQAPAFTAEAVNGETLSLVDLHSEKPVILDFWATWCPNCRRDMPRLSALAEKYADDVTVLGVNLQEDEDSVKEFNREFGTTFNSVVDEGAIARSYGIAYTNTHVLIDTEGNIFDVISGDISESQVVALIEASQDSAESDSSADES